MGITIQFVSGSTGPFEEIISGGGKFFDVVTSWGTDGAHTSTSSGAGNVENGATVNVAFLATGSGGLEIADSNANSSAFTGKISGFGGVNHSNHKQFIDLVSVTSAPGQIHLRYTSGTLFVSSGGTVVAQLNMIGAYTSANFSAKADSNGHVEIFDPSVPHGGSVAPMPAQTFARGGADLRDIAFGAPTTLAYSQNAADTAGTMTASDRHTAAVALLGNYMAGTLVTVADGHGGALAQEARPDQQPLLTHPPHG